MKKYPAWVLLVIFMTAATPVLNAAPERIAIKDAEKVTKERLASSQIKNIDLQDIEDPAAKRAIQEILNYLGLESQGVADSK